MTDNFSVECPDGHGRFSGYLHPDIELKYSCPECGKDMTGYRIIQVIEKELK